MSKKGPSKAAARAGGADMPHAAALAALATLAQAFAFKNTTALVCSRCGANIPLDAHREADIGNLPHKETCPFVVIAAALASEGLAERGAG
jgi:hypothetical protein